MQYSLTECYAIQSNIMQFNAAQQYNGVQSSTEQCNAVWCGVSTISIATTVVVTDTATFIFTVEYLQSYQ